MEPYFTAKDAYGSAPNELCRTSALAKFNLRIRWPVGAQLAIEPKVTFFSIARRFVHPKCVTIAAV